MRRGILTAGLVGAGVLAAVLLRPSAVQPETSATPTPAATPAHAPGHAQAAEVGDCYLISDDAPTWGMGHVEFVDCAAPHRGQLVASTMLDRPGAIDPEAVIANDPDGATLVDFAMEFCAFTVWQDHADVPDAGVALYVPANLITDGVTEDVVCGLETAQPRTGSLPH